MFKRKLGLSLVLALAMMLVFSAVALAAAVGVTGLRGTVDGNLKVQALWTKDADSNVTGYTVTVKDLSDQSVVETKTVAKTVTSYTSTATVNTNKNYSITVVTNGGANDAGSSSLTVNFASNSEITLPIPEKDNAFNNANQSGTKTNINDGTTLGDTIKSENMVKNDGTIGNQRTHGEYQNNTNSCASCHQTHTGASKNLLFKDGVYSTCTACHDGTLGFYNVFEASNAGTFGGTHDGNMSIHLADGTVQVKAAPGGNGAANSGSWVNEFNCASCHSPHGSYSDRLLHYSPNGMGLAKKADGGIGIIGGTVYSFSALPTTASVTDSNVIAVKGKASDFGLVAADIDGAVPADTTAITVFEKSGTTWVKSTTPWLYGYAYGSPKNYYTRFYKDPGTESQMKVVDGDYVYIADFHDNELGNSEINFGKGFIYSKGTYLDDVKTADVGRAYTVALDLVKIATFGDQTNGVPIYKTNVNSLFDGSKAGTGVQVSTYCASCHTDYLAKAGVATGTFSSAYRHNTTSDSYTCLRCHYAHGTDVNVMMDAKGQKVEDLTKTGALFEGDTAKAQQYMLDQNPSSALKRYTNMAVCWGCHTDSKAEQLKNTYGFTKNAAAPHGLEAQPNVAGKITATNPPVVPTP